MSISHCAADVPMIIERQDMKSSETIRSNTKTNAICAGEQDGFIRYGAKPLALAMGSVKRYGERNIMLTKLCSKCGRVMSLGSALCPACLDNAGSRHTHYDANVRDKRSARFYTSTQWIRLRDLILSRAGYQCALCKAHGRLTPATEVHHKIPIKVDWSKRLDAGNCIALCHRCHMMEERKLRQNG